MSIIVLPPKANLVGDGGFEQSGFGAWTVRLGPGITAAIDRHVRSSGRDSLRLTAQGERVPTSIVLVQELAVRSDSSRGLRYTLRFRVRTIGLSRSIQAELKLNYAGGGYAFFRGGPSRAAAVKHTGVPAGTSGQWIPIVVKATARFPVESISVFVLDSGPGPLTGTLWIDDVELRSID